MKLKKVLSTALALTMVFTLGAPVLAADDKDAFPHRYNSENGKFEMSKISHPDKPANYRHAGPKIPDGIVDYLGDGKIGVPGVDVGAVGQGDRGQTYCWGSIAYGDYMYVNTLYDAAGNTEQLFGAAGGNVGEDGYSSEVMDKISACLYRGDIFNVEPDGKTAGCALVKINMKTGETKILMTKVSKEHQNYEAKSKVKVGNLILDLLESKAFLEDEDIHLTKTEFNMLKIFIENKNRELSSDEIYKLVWGKNSVGDTRNIRKHVMNIRNKIRAEESDSFDILTSYGKGYTFIEC